MLRNWQLSLALLLALVADLGAQVAPARAIADLVFAAFRDADSVRRIERPIDAKARAGIEKRLPFKPHFDELSTHVLHVAFRGKKPIGLLYVRTEETEWGLADIAWAVSLDGRVVSFEFVNSRSDRATNLPTTSFGRSLLGHGFAELLRAERGQAGDDRPALDGLESVVARSAMKATVVIDVVWADEVQKLADLAMLYDEFPGAERFRRSVALAPSGDGAVTRGVMRVMEALAQGHYELGSAIATTCHLGGRDVAIRWVLGTDGRIVRVTPAESWATKELRAWCSTMSGRRLDDVPLADNPLATASNEVALALAEQRRAKGRDQR